MTNATAQAPRGCLSILSRGPQLCLRCFYNGGDHGWVLSLWPHRVTKAHTFLFFFFNYQMEHKPSPSSTHSLLWANPSCATSKAALHPHPKSSALSTTRTGVTTGLRACGAGGKREETQPQVVFQCPAQPWHSSVLLAVVEINITRSRVKDNCNSTRAKKIQTANNNLFIFFIIITIIITTI